MTITAAIVLFASIWFLVFFIVLPLGFTSQAEAGEVVPGTPASAPARPMAARKALWTTGITVLVWAGVYTLIVTGVISVANMAWTTELISPTPKP